MMLVRLAWRNVWRNRRRSLIILTSIVVGVVASLFIDAFSRGYIKQVFENELGSHMAHIQIHARGFSDNKVVQGFMADDGFALAAARADPVVLHATRRTITFGLASSASNSSGASIVGVDPAEEAAVTTIARSVASGRYLSGAPNEILIGERLAATLDVGLGDRVVAMASTADGKVGTEMFRVVGLYRTVSSVFDRMYVYIPIADAQRMLHAEGRIAEIAIVTREIGHVTAVRDALRRRLDTRYEVLSYRDIMPSLIAMMEVTESVLNVFAYIIGLAMVFGIINMMLMSVFERIREFGVLKSIGMGNGTLLLLIELEALLLGCVGAAAGAVLGIGVNLLLGHSGLNFAAFAEGLAAFGTGAILYPVLDYDAVVSTALVIIAFCLVAALYPAARAMKLEPIHAVRYE